MLRGYRMPEKITKAFRATIPSGVKSPNFNMDGDINDFHCSFGHVHEGLLRETAKQRNANLTGTLRECQGFSIGKGRAKPISTITGTRVAKPGGRVFHHVGGEKIVQSIGGRNTCSRFEVTSLGSMLSNPYAARTKFPNTSDITSQTTVLLVYHAQ